MQQTTSPSNQPARDQRDPRERARRRAQRVAQREEVRKEQKAANWRAKWLPFLIGAVALLVVLAAFFFLVIVPRAQPIDGLEKFSGLSRDHVAGAPTYPQVPPVGGAHSNVWQNCGIYDTPVPSEMAVHSLEHGAVWITYQSTLPDSEVQKLRDLVRGKDYALLSPWSPDGPVLDSPIAAVAWGLQLKVDRADDPRLAEFVRRYMNGPQTPEAGAVCRGGVGTPLQG